MSNDFEMVGIILVICGIIYTFLRGMGKLPVVDIDEFESKILKIKGSPGLILIALGIILFPAGSYTTPTPTPTPTLTPPPIITPISTLDSLDTSKLTSGRATIKNAFTDYDNSGFRFDSNSVVAWNSKQADILASSRTPTSNTLSFFLQYDAPPFNAEQDKEAWSGIIEMLQTKLEQVTECPSSGYKYHWADAKVNAVYCVQTRDGQHFAKIKVARNDGIMVFDWVYQPSGSRYFG